MGIFVQIADRVQEVRLDGGDLQFGVPPLDRGFLYGEALMETILTLGHSLILPLEHLRRLRESAESLSLELPWTNEQLVFEMEALVRRGGYPQGFLRLLVTGGSGFQGLLSKTESSNPGKFLYYGPYEHHSNLASNSNLTQGSSKGESTENSKVAHDGLVNLKRKIGFHFCSPSRIKTNNYLPEIIALRQVVKEGYQDVLWTREDGELLEASTSNIFLMARIGDQLEIVTPPKSSGILPGITRQKIIDLLIQAKIPVTEQKVYVDEIPRFDEAFLTSSLAGLRPVKRIDRHSLHTGRPQAAFQHIDRLYKTWLRTQMS